MKTLEKLDSRRSEHAMPLQVETVILPGDRELIREQLAWVAEELRDKYGMSSHQIRNLLQEMLTVSV